MSAVDRFWAKVDRRGPAECWPWLAGKMPTGYGRFWMSERRPAQFAHRVALELALGRPIARGVIVCHRCDNPSCVNPAHLWEGTPADNTRDMVNKGRLRPPYGERCAAHKLTAVEVLAIRASDEPQAVLAARYGVRDSSISRIKAGKRWGHLSEEAPR